VVVHEARQVQPLVAPEQEREDVRLPQLVGLGALEAPHGVLALLLRRRLRHQARLVKDAPDLGLGNPNGLEARKQIANPARAVLGVLLAELDHRVTLGGLLLGRLLSDRRTVRAGLQRVGPTLLVALHPVRQRRPG
jgi:hypothetical protein